MTPKIILASKSAIRAQILKHAGVPFTAIATQTDEDKIKADLAGKGASIDEIAIALATAKCQFVPPGPNEIVIGSDQILDLDGEAFDKPKSMDDAFERISLLQGRAHRLVNAVTIARNGAVISQLLDRPVIHMRALAAAEIKAYLQAAGPEILKSVAAYQVERLGARLIERIEGDYFSVLGLSLYPVLSVLRSEGALEF